MESRQDIWLWLVQRGTAFILVLFVLIHFGTIVLTVGKGLSADAIVARVSGNFLFLTYYGLFAVSAALHGAIGARNFLREITQAGRAIDLFSLLLCLTLLWLGLRAVFGLYGLAA